MSYEEEIQKQIQEDPREEQLRRTKQNKKHWYHHWKLGLGVILVACNGFYMYNIYQGYQHTSKWQQTNKNANLIAQQSPKDIYRHMNMNDSQGIKDKIDNYHDIYHSMLKNNGSLTRNATLKQISKIRSAYHQIPKSQQSTYQQGYYNLINKIKINDQYNNLFENQSGNESTGGTLKSYVTPKYVLKLNQRTYAKLSNISLLDPQDQFIKDISKLRVTLISDIKNIIPFMKDVTSTINIQGDTAKISENANKNLLVESTGVQSKLYYNWQSIAYVFQLVKQMQGYINKVITNNHTYEQQKADMKYMQEAYNKYDEQNQANKFKQKIKEEK